MTHIGLGQFPDRESIFYLFDSFSRTMSWISRSNPSYSRASEARPTDWHERQRLGSISGAPKKCQDTHVGAHTRTFKHKHTHTGTRVCMLNIQTPLTHTHTQNKTFTEMLTTPFEQWEVWFSVTHAHTEARPHINTYAHVHMHANTTHTHTHTNTLKHLPLPSCHFSVSLAVAVVHSGGLSSPPAE